MKISNLFTLCSCVFISWVFIWPRLSEQKHVTRKALNENYTNNKTSFDKNLYNYRPIPIEETFDEVVIIDTTNLKERSEKMLQTICWIPSPQHGIKVKTYSNFGDNHQVKDRKLILYRNSEYMNSDVLFIYAPHIKKFEIQNASIAFAEMKADQLDFHLSNCGNIRLLASNDLPKINLQAAKSNCKIEADKNTLVEVNIDLKDESNLECQVYKGEQVNIKGDVGSKVHFYYDKKTGQADGQRGVIGKMTFNNEIGQIKLTRCSVNQLDGDKRKLVLDMPFEEARKAIALLSQSN